MASSRHNGALGAGEGATAQPQMSSRQHRVTEHIGKKLAPWPDLLRWCWSELPGASGCLSLPVTNYTGFPWAPSDFGVMERGCLLQTAPPGKSTYCTWAVLLGPGGLWVPESPVMVMRAGLGLGQGWEERQGFRHISLLGFPLPPDQ